MKDLIEQLRRAALVTTEAGPSDGDLLERFLAHRDAVAFEALVRRHGPMVLGVCRRLLRHTQDAEDAFQATFLVLVRKATTILPRERVGDWLYGVARQTARKANATRSRRQMRERSTEGLPEPGTPPDPPLSDLEVHLERELAALPEKYRAVLLLCDRNGLTRAEAAAHLGWPVGTVSSRLSRGRELLAERLGKRGLTLPASGLSAGAVVPAGLVQATTQAASVVASGTAATGAISAPVLALMEGVLQSMVPLKLKFLAAVILTVGCFGFALGAGQGLLQGPKSAQAPDPAPDQPAPAPAPGVARDVDFLLHAKPSDTVVVGPWEYEEFTPARLYSLHRSTLSPEGTLFYSLASNYQPSGYFAYTVPTSPIPPELIQLLVRENDPEKRKLLGQLIEAYQRDAPVNTYHYRASRVVLSSNTTPYYSVRPTTDPEAEKQAALKKAEEAIRKLREGTKGTAAETYDSLLKNIQKLKGTEPPR
jgi:RNA polymerase sigma factor (sigma-70 family)